MKLGVMYFPTDLSAPCDVLAKEVEDRGIESLWVTEHTHIPVSRRTPWPGGSDLPEEYRRTLDPFVALTVAAAATTRLRLGTGIALVAQHHPISLAKRAASLDFVSNGRFLFGVGVGWNHEEMLHHGVDPATRRRRAREHVLAIRELWTQDEASFSGEFVAFEPSWSWPKPVQRPHPPILMGAAAGPRTFAQVVEYADGWMPLHSRGAPILDQLSVLRKTAEEAGRDPETIEISVLGCPPSARVLASYRDAGVSRIVFWLPATPWSELEPHLDGLTGVVAEFGDQA